MPSVSPSYASSPPPGPTSHRPWSTRSPPPTRSIPSTSCEPSDENQEPRPVPPLRCFCPCCPFRPCRPCPPRHPPLRPRRGPTPPARHSPLQHHPAQKLRHYRRLPLDDHCLQGRLLRRRLRRPLRRPPGHSDALPSAKPHAESARPDLSVPP